MRAWLLLSVLLSSLYNKIVIRNCLATLKDGNIDACSPTLLKIIQDLAYTGKDVSEYQKVKIRYFLPYCAIKELNKCSKRAIRLIMPIINQSIDIPQSNIFHGTTKTHGSLSSLPHNIIKDSVIYDQGNDGVNVPPTTDRSVFNYVIDRPIISDPNEKHSRYSYVIKTQNSNYQSRDHSNRSLTSPEYKYSTVAQPIYKQSKDLVHEYSSFKTDKDEIESFTAKDDSIKDSDTEATVDDTDQPSATNRDDLELTDGEYEDVFSSGDTSNADSSTTDDCFSTKDNDSSTSNDGSTNVGDYSTTNAVPSDSNYTNNIKNSNIDNESKISANSKFKDSNIQGFSISYRALHDKDFGHKVAVEFMANDVNDESDDVDAVFKKSVVEKSRLQNVKKSEFGENNIADDLKKPATEHFGFKYFTNDISILKPADKDFDTEWHSIDIRSIYQGYEDSYDDSSEVKQSRLNHSLIEDYPYADESVVKDSETKHSVVDESKAKDSKLKNSTVSESSEIENTSLNNATIFDVSKAINASISDSSLDHSEVQNSNIHNSKIKDSAVNKSDTGDSKLNDSIVKVSDVGHSKLNDSAVKESDISHSDVQGSKISSSIIDTFQEEDEDDMSDVGKSNIKNNTDDHADDSDSNVKNFKGEQLNEDVSNMKSSDIKHPEVQDSGVKDSSVKQISIDNSNDIDNTDMKKTVAKVAVDEANSRSEDLKVEHPAADSNVSDLTTRNSKVTDSDVRPSAEDDSEVVHPGVKRLDIAGRGVEVASETDDEDLPDLEQEEEEMDTSLLGHPKKHRLLSSTHSLLHFLPNKADYSDAEEYAAEAEEYGEAEAARYGAPMSGAGASLIAQNKAEEPTTGPNATGKKGDTEVVAGKTGSLSQLTNATAKDSKIHDSAIDNTGIVNSDVENSNVSNSRIHDATLRNDALQNTVIDKANISNFYLNNITVHGGLLDFSKDSIVKHLPDLEDDEEEPADALGFESLDADRIEAEASPQDSYGYIHGDIDVLLQPVTSDYFNQDHKENTDEPESFGVEDFVEEL